MAPADAPTALNGICPYFTMFRLEFPLSVLGAGASPGDVVLDPFCGRGTTNYAGRVFGLSSFGAESSPVAVALTAAKLASTTPSAILHAARQILDEMEEPRDLPSGEFWEWAYHPEVLRTVCRLREGLLRDSTTDARHALRAIILGALHGPRPKGGPSHLSNQSPRTYAPKPRYAVRFWRTRGLRPENVDVLSLLELRAARYYGRTAVPVRGAVILADSRRRNTYAQLLSGHRVNWVITSPPYYGMNMYIPDQWLRHWFVGGPPRVDYSTVGQVAHSSPRAYATQLRQVWMHVGEVCEPSAKLAVRFGGIHDRKANPLSIIKASFAGTGWRIDSIRSAGTAAKGRRQALHFSGIQRNALEERDIQDVWDP
jgi:hypothetical protein